MQRAALPTPACVARLPARRLVCRTSAHARSQEASSEVQKAAASLALASAFLAAPAAWAEEVAADAAATAAAAAEAAPEPIALPASVEVGLVLSPIVLYAIFNVYRNQVNPQAKLSDFLFIVAAIAIVGNIASIVIFKRRFF